MRRAVLVLLVVLAGCGGETPSPEIEFDASWAGDQIAVDVDTNVPDGAILSWYAVEGRDWHAPDAATVRGFASVEDGAASAAIDASEFSDGAALVEVALVPHYEDQPDVVADNYEPSDGVAVQQAVSR